MSGRACTARTQNTLAGQPRKELKGRVSFFKRLSIQSGNVAANYEDILIAVRQARL